MQAIISKFYPATTHKPARYLAVATGGAGRVVLPSVNIPLRTDPNVAVVLALCRRLGWSGRLVPGPLPHNRGWVWVWVPEPTARSEDGPLGSYILAVR